MYICLPIAVFQGENLGRNPCKEVLIIEFREHYFWIPCVSVSLSIFPVGPKIKPRGNRWCHNSKPQWRDTFYSHKKKCKDNWIFTCKNKTLHHYFTSIIHKKVKMYSRLECKTLNQEALRRKNRNKVPCHGNDLFYMIPKA